MKNNMKRIEKLGLGELKLCFKPYISGVSGEKNYPVKTVIKTICSRNHARSVSAFLEMENDGEVYKMFWNGKEISEAFFKVTHRSLAA